MHSNTRTSWRARGLQLGIIVTAAAGAAVVARATPGGTTKHALSFAGRLTGPSAVGKSLQFELRNESGATCVPPVTLTSGIDSDGNFVAELDMSSTACSKIFDGGNVTYTIQVAGEPKSAPMPVNPVPYAKYADVAASAIAAGGSLDDRIKAIEAALDDKCPVGFTNDGAVSGIVVCKRANDQVVRVGVGRSAFWIDRYEASIWDGPTQRFATADDTSTTFPKNGQATASWVAISRPSVMPARNVTWFQAQAACRAAGKRLATGEEWLAAASGSIDPGSNPGGSTLSPTTNARCNTSSSGLRTTGAAGSGPGSASSCISRWGAEDMIGNLWEWTSDWVAASGDSTTYGTWPGTTASTGAYDSDGTWSISGSAINDSAATRTAGLPSAVLRGGGFTNGDAAGLFATNLNYAPSGWLAGIGFRCVVPR